MNLLPITVANTAATADSGQDKGLSAPIIGSQLSEFNDHLETSLAQHGHLGSRPPGLAEQGAQQLLQIALPELRQELPLTGKSLPPIAATDADSESMPALSVQVEPQQALMSTAESLIASIEVQEAVSVHINTQVSTSVVAGTHHIDTADKLIADTSPLTSTVALSADESQAAQIAAKGPTATVSADITSTGIATNRPENQSNAAIAPVTAIINNGAVTTSPVTQTEDLSATANISTKPGAAVAVSNTDAARDIQVKTEAQQLAKEAAIINSEHPSSPILRPAVPHAAYTFSTQIPAADMQVAAQLVEPMQTQRGPLSAPNPAVSNQLAQNPLAQQSAGSEHFMNSQAEQGSQPLLTEARMTATESASDFSRMVEKGLAQLGKEMPTAAAAALTEPAARASLDGMKLTNTNLLLQQPIDKPKWGDEFGSRMVWMSKEGIQNAQLRLTPGNLGTIDVKITIQNEQANISFVSQHGAVRDAIEATLPRLREMMQEAGVKMEQANVSSGERETETQQRQDDKRAPGHFAQNQSDSMSEEPESLANNMTDMEHDGVLSAIDYYA